MAEVAGLHCSVSEADGGEGEVAGLRRMGGVLLECWISACCAKRRDIGRTRIANVRPIGMPKGLGERGPRICHIFWSQKKSRCLFARSKFNCLVLGS